MKVARFRQRPWLMALALVFAVQTAAAAMCVMMPAAHAMEMATAGCHAMLGTTDTPAAMHAQHGHAPHACSHCDAPDMGAPDAPAAVAMPAMALLAVLAPVEPAAGAAAPGFHRIAQAHAPPAPVPLYLTTQRLRI